jgi:hypothetical protein
MAANINPIFTGTPDCQLSPLMTAANTTLDLNTGTSYLLYTADATNGSFVREVRLKAAPANATAATVFRVWLNTGAAINTTNTILLTEVGIPATAASNTNANPDFIVPINFPLAPGYKLYGSFGTAAGGSGQWTATTVAGKY